MDWILRKETVLAALLCTLALWGCEDEVSTSDNQNIFDGPDTVEDPQSMGTGTGPMLDLEMPGTAGDQGTPSPGGTAAGDPPPPAMPNGGSGESGEGTAGETTSTGGPEPSPAGSMTSEGGAQGGSAGPAATGGAEPMGNGGTTSSAGGAADGDGDEDRWGPAPQPDGTLILCTDTCALANDGACQDGGPNTSSTFCRYGTDCTDCGGRSPGDFCPGYNRNCVCDDGRPALDGRPPAEHDRCVAYSDESDCGRGRAENPACTRCMAQADCSVWGEHYICLNNTCSPSRCGTDADCLAGFCTIDGYCDGATSVQPEGPAAGGAQGAGGNADVPDPGGNGGAPLAGGDDQGAGGSDTPPVVDPGGACVTDAQWDGGTRCSEDTDCAGCGDGLNHCVSYGKCKACTDNAHCENPLVCASYYRCVQCQSDQDVCPAGQYCVGNTCFDDDRPSILPGACITDSEWDRGDRCASSSDCRGCDDDETHCNSIYQACVECESGVHECPAGQHCAGTRCFADSGNEGGGDDESGSGNDNNSSTCVSTADFSSGGRCESHSDCSGCGDDLNYCASHGACKECTEDTHCADALICASYNACVQCETGRDVCPSGQYCSGNRCFGGESSGGGSSVCSNTCQWANDNACDDGGPDSQYSVCDLGSDCDDCGPRN